MERQDFDTTPSPVLGIQEVYGDVSIRGEERSRVSIIADPEDVHVEQSQDTLRVTCQGDCDIRAPVNSSVEIARSHGDVFIKNIIGKCTIQEVLACLSMRAIRLAKIETVHGDLSVKGVDADLYVTRVLGNAAVREVEGDCILEEVHGNLDLRQVHGKVTAHALGNLYVRLEVLPPGEHLFHAEGNLYCHVLEGVDIHFNLSSMGENIFLRTPEESKALHQPKHVFTLGEASAVVNLYAGGNLYLYINRATDLETEEAFSSLREDFGQQIMSQVEAQIGAQMEAMSRQLDDRLNRLAERLMEAGVSPARAEEALERARQMGERETQRAQERIRRAQEKLQRKLEAARRKREIRLKAFERRSAGRRVGPFFQTAPPTPSASEPVSEEERLFILRMLQEKKITIEEASRLLDALEGKAE